MQLLYSYKFIFILFILNFTVNVLAAIVAIGVAIHCTKHRFSVAASRLLLIAWLGTACVSLYYAFTEVVIKFFWYNYSVPEWLDIGLSCIEFIMGILMLIAFVLFRPPKSEPNTVTKELHRA